MDPHSQRAHWLQLMYLYFFVEKNSRMNGVAHGLFVFNLTGIRALLVCTAVHKTTPERARYEKIFHPSHSNGGSPVRLHGLAEQPPFPRATHIYIPRKG